MIQDAIDLTTVHVLGSSPRVLQFPITAALVELGVYTGGLHLHVDSVETWPAVAIDDSGPSQAATLWVFVRIAGVWYATGAERLRPAQLQGDKPEGDPSDLIGTQWLYDPHRWGPMAGYNPSPGELVGFMVAAGSTRSDDQTPVQARTPVVLFPWPASPGARVIPFTTAPSTAPPAPLPAPPDPPTPGPSPPLVPPVAGADEIHDALLALVDVGDQIVAALDANAAITFRLVERLAALETHGVQVHL